MTEPATVTELHTFEAFWKAYPKKVGKPLAKAKWDAITNGGLTTRTMDKDSGQYVEIELQATPAELVEGAKKYAKSLVVDTGDKYVMTERRFICHPSTWLNQGRWMDDA